MSSKQKTDPQSHDDYKSVGRDACPPDGRTHKAAGIAKYLAGAVSRSLQKKKKTISPFHQDIGNLAQPGFRNTEISRTGDSSTLIILNLLVDKQNQTAIKPSVSENILNHPPTLPITPNHRTAKQKFKAPIFFFFCLHSRVYANKVRRDDVRTR